MNTIALTLSDTVAEILADPATAPLRPCTRGADRQSLAYGLTGIALLHVERAASDRGPWQRAHAWLAAAARQPSIGGPGSHPFYGAPALAHALTCAAEHHPGSYERALAVLDTQVSRDVHRRLAEAYRRLETKQLAELAEFDTIRGLSGYGAYLLRRPAHHDTLRAVLDYCVELTRPLVICGTPLPGWWTASGPSGKADERRFPGGHANNGLAHGIAGVLALLACTARAGHLVSNHHEAIATILAWLDRWQEKPPAAANWPYWVTRRQLHDGLPSPRAVRRPSWCYGTAGLARAQQLAGNALGDIPRQQAAEEALATTLVDPAHLSTITHLGLCHGFSGLAHIAARAANDALPTTRGLLQAAVPALLNAACPDGTDLTAAAHQLVNADPGFLDGAAGIALGLLAPAAGTSPRTMWDACLLVT